MKLIVLIASCSLALNCMSQSTVYPSESLKGEGQRLTDLYKKAFSNDSVKYQRAFINAFPETFAKLDSIYGEIDIYKSVLYDVAYEHISSFCLFLEATKEEDFQKMMKVCRFGSSKADAGNILADCVYEKVVGNPALALKVLSSYSEKEIRSIWYYLFDGPHPDDPDVKRRYEILYKKVKSINSKMAELMKSEYDRLLTEMDHHGH